MFYFFVVVANVKPGVILTDTASHADRKKRYYKTWKSGGGGGGGGVGRVGGEW